MAHETALTGVERTFAEDEVIVSKTDLKGRITYCNNVFQRLAGMDEKHLLGQPHSIIRHPDMPRCIFKLLWDTLGEGNEIFAYVLNRSVNGDHYWVLAHVTPSYDTAGTVVGYHSNRRVANRRVLDDVVTPLYRQLLQEEARHDNRKEGMLSAYAMVGDLLAERQMGYDELIFSLQALQ